MSGDRRSEPAARGVFGTLVDRPVGLFVIFATLIVVGLIAYARIPLQLLPSGIQGTRLGLWVNHPGSSAAENEEKVTRPLEEQIRTLPNLKDFFSRSGEGSVFMRIAFNGTADMDLAKAELRDRIERARPLMPDTVDRIMVFQNDDGDPPIMFFAILVEERTTDMDYLVEHEIQRRFEAVDGVSRVQIWGVLDDSVRILLDEDRVRAMRLDIGGLIQRLAQDNFAEPMGEVTDGGRRFLLRSDMRFESLEEIADYPIGDGLRVRDVASVEKVKTVRDWLTRIDGKEAYYGMIQKESTANVVAVSKGLDEVIEGLADNPELAGRAEIEVFFSQARFIEHSLAQLRSTAVWGGGLAVLVLFLFLRRVRMTLCVALSIPVSALLAVAYEAFTGGSFNVLTMTGLTLGIGMLVDNSVVVIENIARLRGQGHSRRSAAVEGVRDVALAIALATLTTVVVFLPLIFMGDDAVMRTMLEALGIPLCTSLLFSLVMGIVFLPVIASRVLGERAGGGGILGPALSAITGPPVRLMALAVGAAKAGFWGFVWGLRWFLRIAVGALTPLRWILAPALIAAAVWRVMTSGEAAPLARRLTDLGAPAVGGGIAAAPPAEVVAGALLAAGLILFGLPIWRRRTAPALARPARVVPPGHSVLDWIRDGNRALLAWTLNHRLLASVLGVVTVMTVAIPWQRMTLTAFGQEHENAEISIRVDMENNFTLEEASREMARYEQLLEGYREELGYEHLVSRFGAGGGELEMRWGKQQDPDQLDRWRERFRRELPRFPGHRVVFGREQQMDVATRQYVHFQLRGPRADLLEQYGQRAVEVLRDVPGLYDVASSLEDAPEQVRLVLDRETAYSYGVTSQAALRNVSWALRGAALPRYQEEGREVPFFIEYDEAEVAGLDTLRDLEVFTTDSVVPLAAFAEIEFQRGQRQITRWNGQTTFNIQARVGDPTQQGRLVEKGYAALETLDLPRGFTLGRDQSARARQQEEMAEMLRALVLSVVLVMLLMGILFESLLLPFSVLSTIPFAVAGALWTLYVTGTVMDSVGWIGVIILVGVVVNNGIVLIDKIHRIRRSGVDRKRAVLDGAEARVRPILMTALTTIFGLLPMALSTASSDGIDYRALATCVAGGLAVSTFFTLWIVPLAYTVFDDLGRGLRWTLWRAWIQPRKRALEAGAEPSPPAPI